jgi:pimeloyl-[acyl-carrier protein] methyl ester esterase
VPDKLTLVLLPGLDGTGTLFAPFVAALPGHVEAQVVSYPPDEPLGYEALVQRVEAQLPRGRPFVLLGESFSGPLALKLAARAPQGLVGLVLVATFHQRPTARLLGLLQPLLGAPLFSLPVPRVLLKQLLTGGDAPAALVEQVREALWSVKAEVLALRAKETTTVDASAAARAVKVPALALFAERDGLMRPELPEELKALMPQLEVLRLPTPHLVLQTLPRASAEAVVRFAEASL